MNIAGVYTLSEILTAGFTYYVCHSFRLFPAKISASNPETTNTVVHFMFFNEIF